MNFCCLKLENKNDLKASFVSLLLDYKVCLCSEARKHLIRLNILLLKIACASFMYKVNLINMKNNDMLMCNKW